MIMADVNTAIYVSNILLYFSYFLVAIAALGSILFPLIRFISDPIGWQRTAIGIGSALVFFFVSYGLASDVIFTEIAKYGVSAETTRFVGGVLILTYIAILLAIAGIIYSEVIKLIRS